MTDRLIMVLIVLCILGIIAVLVTMFLTDRRNKIIYIESATIPDADKDGIIDSIDTNDDDPDYDDEDDNDD